MDNLDKFLLMMDKVQIKTFLEKCYQGDLNSVRQMYNNYNKLSLSDIENGIVHAVDQGNLEIVKFLISENPDIAKKNGELITHAAREGQLEIFRFLHQNGADITFRKNEPLIEAAKLGKLPIVEYFIQNNLNISVENNLALRKATKYNRLEVVKYLVANGADIHAKNDEVVKISAKSGNIEQLDYLLQQGGKKEIAEKYGNPKTQAWILDCELNSENQRNLKRNKL